MAMFDNEQDVLNRLAELRKAHAGVRSEVATREAIGLAYKKGKQWTTAVPDSTGMRVEQWDEDWDPESQEIRVVDNKTAPLVRRIAASTNATRIEATVRPPRHLPGMEYVHRAELAERVLNALHDDAAYTIAARNASSLRWTTGSSLLFCALSRKQRAVPADVATHPDGTPVEVNDRWVRWQHYPLSDLIWEVGNTSRHLENHHVLALERTMTCKQFEQVYGPLEDYGLKRDELPKLKDIAPYRVEAASIDLGSGWAWYQRCSEEPALRVVMHFEADPNDPTHWPIMFLIVDTSPSTPATGSPTGKVVNFDDPVNPYGDAGLPIEKLDAYAQDDSVWSYGLPHALLAGQDMLNIIRSLQIQQLVSTIHGQWLIDEHTVKRERFIEDLSEGVGGVLVWNSRGENKHPPQIINQANPSTQLVPLGADVTLNMRDQVHLSAGQLGHAKSHIPKELGLQLLQNANIVIDNVILEDADHYARLLRISLGTIRRAMDEPNRMLRRLVDRHGFTVHDLIEFNQINPDYVGFRVSVRANAITSRSVDELVQELDTGIETGIITRAEHTIARTIELERPLTDAHQKELDFIARALVAIMNGAEYQGIPSIRFDLFDAMVKQAMHGLDISKPEDLQNVARLQAAWSIQRQIDLETFGSAGQDQTAGPSPTPVTQQAQPLLPDLRGGAPASIDPSVSPVGATGGLPAGLNEVA